MFQMGRIQDSTFFHLLKLQKSVQIKSIENSRERARMVRLRSGKNPGFEIQGKPENISIRFCWVQEIESKT